MQTGSEMIFHPNGKGQKKTGAIMQNILENRTVGRNKEGYYIMIIR